MATDNSAVVSAVSSKAKKDKSSKKTKKAVSVSEDNIEQDTEMATITSDTNDAPSKPKKEKSSKKRKSAVLEGPVSIGDTVAKTVPVKAKKEKSSKKRKSAALDDLDVAATGESTPKTEEHITMTEPEETKAVDEENEQKPPSKKRKVIPDEIEVDVTLPEPPSKKALRMLKKGKALPPSKSGAETTPDPEAKKAKKEVEKRSEHGIWIGNLAFHISKDDLKKFFTEYSDITEDMITRIHMPGPNDGKPANKVEEVKKFVKVVNNKGYAYVDFSTAEGATEAVELSEQLLSGRRVLIKNNKSFEGRPEKTKEETRNDGKPPSKRVFLGNLSFDTTEESLKAHFAKCGAVESVKVATFEDTGKCKGYAWIVFQELEAAQNAVRGYVYIEEETDDYSGSEESSDDDSDADSDEEGGVKINLCKPKPKKTKTRKWWVNKIKGRALRMEFAEDAQVRYKKRYGKDGTKQAGKPAGSGPSTNDEEAPKPARPMKPAKVVEYRQPYAARLTGGIVESKGKKVTF